jgi:hypothetical protein
MAQQPHSWKTVHKQTARRFSFGLLAALSLTLVAFEWRGGDPPPKHTGCVFDEPFDPPMEHPPVIVILRESAPLPPAPKPRTRSNTIEIGEPGPVTKVKPSEPGPVGPATPEGQLVPAETLNKPETIEAALPVGWDMVGVRPYFMECLERSGKTRDACTESRIEKHLQRRFKVPPGIRGPLRTVITFEIDTQGRIGRLVCTPRVAKEVEAEVERVLRSLPEFVPGSQGGHPVAVYYRIPLSVLTL